MEMKAIALTEYTNRDNKNGNCIILFITNIGINLVNNVSDLLLLVLTNCQFPTITIISKIIIIIINPFTVMN